MTSIIPRNPGNQIKSHLALQGIKLKDLAQTLNRPQSGLSYAFTSGSIPLSLAVALEKEGIGTALDWMTQTAAYRLHRYLSKS